MFVFLGTFVVIRGHLRASLCQDVRGIFSREFQTSIRRHPIPGKSGDTLLISPSHWRELKSYGTFFDEFCLLMIGFDRGQRTFQLIIEYWLLIILGVVDYGQSCFSSQLSARRAKSLKSIRLSLKWGLPGKRIACNLNGILVLLDLWQAGAFLWGVNGKSRIIRRIKVITALPNCGTCEMPAWKNRRFSLTQILERKNDELPRKPH